LAFADDYWFYEGYSIPPTLHYISLHHTLHTGVTGEVVIPPGRSRKRNHSTAQHSTAEQYLAVSIQVPLPLPLTIPNHTPPPASRIGDRGREGQESRLRDSSSTFFPSHDHFLPFDQPLPLTPSGVTALAGLESKLRLKPPQSGIVPIVLYLR